MKKFSMVISLCSISISVSAQEDIVSNVGLMTIAPETIMSVVTDFDNKAEGNVISDGTIYYYGNFNNDNLFHHSVNTKDAKVIFSRLEATNNSQILSGKRPTDFYNVVLDNPKKENAFLLTNEMNVKGTLEFKKGIVKVDSLQGAVTFHDGARAINASDISHIDGVIEKIGKNEFTFPSGNSGFYRYAKISAPKHLRDIFEGNYIYNDKEFFKKYTNKSGIINRVNNKEYWIINKGQTNSDSDILLTLTWDERTTPSELLNDKENILRILRWDMSKKMWVDEGGVIDLANRTVTTATNVEGYGFFTLGTVKKDNMLEGDVTIYNFVSVNENGINDFFRIDNITRFPNNSVEIYNRWGVKIYETSNYNSAGNVFRGYAEGRGIVNKGDKLPSGTYFYILKYEYTGKGGSQIIKNTGYLHLDSN